MHTNKEKRYEKGYAVSFFNRVDGDESDIVENFISQNKTQIKLKGFTDLSKFIESLERPRKILLMIKAAGGSPDPPAVARNSERVRAVGRPPHNIGTGTHR